MRSVRYLLRWKTYGSAFAIFNDPAGNRVGLHEESPKKRLDFWRAKQLARLTGC